MRSNENAAARLCRRVMGLGMASTVAVAGLVALAPSTAFSASSMGFNQPGNILIADQFNNRVVEVRGHQVVWQFGDGSSTAGPTSIVGTNDAERIGDLTLISGTGTPAGADPSCANAGGCLDNRVILVNRSGHIVWQYGQAGVSGTGENRLNTPVQSTALPGGDVLITDQGNSRVIEVNRDHEIEWQYGSPTDTITLNGAAFASRLPNGHTLITDSNNNRVVEVTMGKTVAWTYVTNSRKGSMANPLPTRAVRLASGDTLISDQFNDQVIEVNPKHEIVFSQGKIQVDGSGPNQLNAPYDAKVVGDFTGLTVPTGFR